MSRMTFTIYTDFVAICPWTLLSYPWTHVPYLGSLASCIEQRISCCGRLYIGAFTLPWWTFTRSYDACSRYSKTFMMPKDTLSMSCGILTMPKDIFSMSRETLIMSWRTGCCSVSIDTATCSWAYLSCLG
jgi:hypothetical protein